MRNHVIAYFVGFFKRLHVDRSRRLVPGHGLILELDSIVGLFSVPLFESLGSRSDDLHEASVFN